MRIIDKTPFQNEKGDFGLLGRIQGALEYGMAWHSEVRAQKRVITQLDRVLEKGYTLVRNLNLEKSQIIEPRVLTGPAGVFVLYVTPVSGFFEAKGDQWNVVTGRRRAPANINLLKRTARLARAVQVYLNRQGVHLPGMVEPVLIASNARVHIESLRPIVRVVLSDAVKQFGLSLLQARPVLRTEVIREVVDHFLNPRRKALAPLVEPEPAATPVVDAAAQVTEQAPSRARAIFQAAEELKPFDPADLAFQFDEQGEAGVPAGLRDAGPSQQRISVSRGSVLPPWQWITLGLLVVIECVALAGFAYLVFFSPSQ
jgi:hypothetical protein